MKLRYDSIKLKATFTEDGFLMDTPVVGRVGIQDYLNADGSIRKELRTPEEVFSSESLESFKGKPVTIGHPKNRVTSDSARSCKIVGSMLSDGKNGGDVVLADVAVHDALAINSAKNGEISELSLGYTCDLVYESGEWQGQKYDCRQTNIRVNHLALVKKGRAGVARLNLDGDELLEEPNMADEKMGRIRLDSGIEYNADQEVIVAIEALKAEKETISANLSEAKTEVDSLSGERDALKQKVDSFPAEVESAVKDAIEKFKADTQKSAKIDSIAQKHGVERKDMSDRQLQEAVLLKLTKTDAKEKSDAYIEAALDIADSMSNQGSRSKVFTSYTKDTSGISTSSASREKMIKDMKGEK